jgi:hypothetical protein
VRPGRGTRDRRVLFPFIYSELIVLEELITGQEFKTHGKRREY